MNYDAIIIGGGPAGLSAALQLRKKNRSVLVLTGPIRKNPLYRAERIDNYPGLPGVTGAELLERFWRQAEESGAELRLGKALSALPGEGWMLTTGSEMFQSPVLLLTGGVVRAQKYPGEQRLLGRGVSYCAVCDGMLYRRRRVVVVGSGGDAPREANYLAELGCAVTYVSARPPESLSGAIPCVQARRVEIRGEDRVEAVAADGALLPCEGAFILREAVAPTDLLPELETENGYIKVDRRQRTNLPGVYAAGDCTGKPLQISKAVGEGLVAADSADQYLSKISLQ